MRRNKRSLSIIIANKHIFAKMHGSWNDKTGKIILTVSGTIFAKMLGVGMTK